jgi:hypothetical protein
MPAPLLWARARRSSARDDDVAGHDRPPTEWRSGCRVNASYDRPPGLGLPDRRHRTTPPRSDRASLLPLWKGSSAAGAIEFHGPSPWSFVDGKRSYNRARRDPRRPSRDSTLCGARRVRRLRRLRARFGRNASGDDDAALHIGAAVAGRRHRGGARRRRRSGAALSRRAFPALALLAPLRLVHALTTSVHTRRARPKPRRRLTRRPSTTCGLRTGEARASAAARRGCARPSRCRTRHRRTPKGCRGRDCPRW